MCHPPSLFEVKNLGISHGLRLSLTSSLSSISYTYFLNYSFFLGVMGLENLLRKLALGIKSMWWLILLTSGNSLGRSSTTISWYSSNISWIYIGKSKIIIEVIITLGLKTITKFTSFGFIYYRNSLPLINTTVESHLLEVPSSCNGNKVCLMPYF